MAQLLSSDSTAAPLPTLRRASAAPTWWMLVLIALLAAGVFANSLANAFAFDDLAIVQGPHVVDHQWTAIWTDNYWPRNEGVQPDALYRPLTLWSYLANQALSPGVAWPFHLVNVLLHALVCVLAVVLTWRLMGNRRIALVTGVLFAVHPLHTEVIANIVGRAELLAALWSLLALLVFLPERPLTEEIAPTRRPWWHGLLVATCFLAALLSKETPVTLLLALPLLDLWRWTRWQRAVRPSWWRWTAGQSLRYYAPMTAFFSFYLWLRIGACGLMSDVRVTHHIVNGLVDATPMERLVTPFTLLAKYLLLTLWPNHLSADYSLPSLLPTADPFYSTAFQPPAALGIMICILTVIAMVLLWRKAPQFTLLIALFVAGYSLVANFLRIGTIFGERLFYWPGLFVLILIAWAMVAFHRSLASAMPQRTARVILHSSAVAVLGAIVILMGWRSVVRNTDWANNTALAISTARDNPESGKACSWAGAILAMSDRPEYVAFGKTLMERGIELTPDYVTVRWELAKYYGVRHDLGHSAICVAQAARLDPGTHMTRTAIPALIQEMHASAPETYMPLIEDYQRTHSDDEAAYLALAFGYHAQGKYDEAEANARKAIDMAKFVRKDGFDQFHEAGAELATLWFDRGRLQDAVDKFRVYTVYMRNSVEAHCTFASMLLALGAKDNPRALAEADFHLAYAAAIDPTNSRIRGLRGQLNSIRNEWERHLATAEPAAPTGPVAGPLSGVGR